MVNTKERAGSPGLEQTVALGRLQKVPLREGWTREDTEFTPWLAAEENLALLGEALGMSLELVRREQPVGSYSADLLCHNSDDGTAVVIENQLERTDHSHLGQTITYAAGLDAKTVIWIAARFTDDHRAAIDWLNEVSHDTLRFFGLEVELWRIGDSPAAPKFNIIAKPNDWSRAIREAAASSMSDSQRLRLEFWTAFLDHLQEVDGPISGRRTPSKDPWMDWGVGRSGFTLSAPVGFRDGYIGVELVIRQHESFRALNRDRDAIDAEVGQPLHWDLDPDRKNAYLRLRRHDVDPTDRDQWTDLHRWLRVHLETLKRVFEPRVKSLVITEPSEDPLVR